MAITSEWVYTSGKTDTAPLEDEPRNFRIISHTHETQTLAWESSEAGDEDYYEVQQESSPGTWVTVKTGKVYECQITGLQPDTEYNYRIASGKN